MCASASARYAGLGLGERTGQARAVSAADGAADVSTICA